MPEPATTTASAIVDERSRVTARKVNESEAVRKSCKALDGGSHMMARYRAVEVPEPGKLQIVERPVTEPAVGQVRIRVEACGVCHTCLLYTSDAADE